MFPQDFVDGLVLRLGKDRTEMLLSEMDGTPPVSIRLNPGKISSPDILSELPVTDSSVAPTFSRYGYFLSSRPEFYLDPLFHAGAYYVQEASSMYLESIADVIAGMAHASGDTFRVLDLCAAPGGKTTHLLSMLRDIPRSFLVSNEPVRKRAAVLCGNVSRWGEANVVVTNNDPADFRPLAEYFDLILVDAPCSGEGMFRKDSQARDEWSLDNVRLCAARQRRIVSDIWGSLKPGGLLAYSTCTFNDLENKENVNWISSVYKAAILDQTQFYPGESRAGEGFFFSLLRKNGEYGSFSSRRGNIRESGKDMYSRYGDIRIVRDGFRIFRKGDLLKAFPPEAEEDMRRLEGILRVMQSGVSVARLKEGRGADVLILPEFSLIQSLAYRRGSLPEAELPLQSSISYLRRNTVAADSLPGGYVVFTYKGVPFGLGKNIGRRCNNLLPPSLAIRSQN